MRKNPQVDHENAASAEPGPEIPSRRAAQNVPSAAPERVKHQADDVGHLGGQNRVEHQVNRVEHPHLAFRQARESVAPQVVPDRNPTRTERLTQETPSGR